MSGGGTEFANTFKAGLYARRRMIGLWQALASPYTAEICAGAGFDWLLFDGEHGPHDIPLLLGQLQAVAPYPVHPVARPPIGETYIIKQYLDIGFQTLLVPFVETAAQARDLVRAMQYPPHGVRGLGAGLARAARWNRIPNYLDRADAEMCLLVQIETPRGLQNLDAIAAVEGVDGVFLGRADLSAAMGHRGAPNHPEMAKIAADAIGRILAAGKAAGVLVADPTEALRSAQQGCGFIAVGTDVGLLAKSCVDLARAVGLAVTNGGQAGGY